MVPERKSQKGALVLESPYIARQVMRHHRNNQDLVKKKRPHLKLRPLRCSSSYDELTVKVSSNWYHQRQTLHQQFPSRLIGQLLRVRLWDVRLNRYVGNDKVMSRSSVSQEKGENAGQAYRLPAFDRQPDEEARSVLPCNTAK